MKQLLKKISSSKVGFLLKRLVGFVEFFIMSYYHDEKTIKFLKTAANEDSPFLLNPSELYNIYAFAKLQNSIPGHYAEVGVYKGATAKAICEQKNADKKLYLFDTFAGLPDVDDIDREMFADAMYDATMEQVQAKLSSYSNVELHKGYFPADTSHVIENEQFAFVHLDVDLYKSTREALDFFYPRLSPSAVLISHDYHAAGVRKAFDEFQAETGAEVLQLATSQCIVLKR